MLSPSDLSSFDLATLATALEASALRQDRTRRLAESIGIPSECKDALNAVAAVDADAAATAEACRLVATIRRFAADEGHARPSLIRRALEALGRSHDPRGIA